LAGFLVFEHSVNCSLKVFPHFLLIDKHF